MSLKFVSLFALSLAMISLPSASAASVKTKKTVKTIVKTAAPAQSKKVTSTVLYSDAITARLQELTVALANGDARSLSNLWLEDGTYTNENGQEWKGREALERRFSTVFANQGRLLLDFIPVNVRLLADNVATADGYVKFKDEVSGVPGTRFAMVFQKQAQGWMIVSASETPYVVADHLDHLRPLSWLIGEWTVQKDGATMQVKADWAANKKFIHMRYLAKKADQEVLDSQQIIGWDPRIEQIVSWTFDARGGFGSGSWLKRGNQWLIDSVGVEQNGKATKATNVIADQNANSFTWQSVNRSVDGETFSDTQPLTITRVNPTR